MTDVNVNQAPHCYRHPKVTTYVSCSRCGKPICPDCMLEAPVGFQCAECFYPTGRGGSMRAPESMARAVPIAIGIAAVWTLALAALALIPAGEQLTLQLQPELLFTGKKFLFPGSPNILLAGIAGGVTGWALWRLCGKAWNARSALWGLALGLAMPLLASGLVLLAVVFGYGVIPGSILSLALRVLIAMGVSGLFGYLLASPPE